MKTKFIFIWIILLNIANNADAQSNVENILAEISKNNKSIQANNQLWKTMKTEFNTGLTLSDPFVEFDYLIGSPSEAGNQTELMIAQQFEFPSVYSKRNQLADDQSAQSDFQMQMKRQDILLEAKKVCLELIYRNKLNEHLELRKLNAEKLLKDFQIKLTSGDGNIPDVNKAKLQLIEINKNYQNNLSEINQLSLKLTEFNGGNTIVFPDTAYPQIPFIPAFEKLESEIEINDPVRKLLEQEKKIAQSNIDLSKAMSLPKFELGYHYQGILGDKYHGVHVGMSIPLWENRNKVILQRSKLSYSDMEIKNHSNEHYFEIKQMYEKYENLKITLEEYMSVFSSLNSLELLDKSLSLGEISTIEYLMELSYFYNAFDNYLETEAEYHSIVAELYKFKL